MRSALPAKILLLLVSLAATAGLLEVAARVYLHRFASPEEFLRYAALADLDEAQLARGRNSTERRYSPHRYLGYIPTPGYSDELNRHNSLGFRGEEIAIPKPAGEFRIVFLGGSTTYEGGVKDYRLAAPQLVEDELVRRGYRTVRVINAGAESYSSWESLVNLEFRVLDLEPDLIIDYDGINDVDARLVWPREAYRGDNSGRRRPNTSSIFESSLLERSTLLRILLVSSGRTMPQAEMARTIDQSAKSWQAPKFWKQWRQRTYPTAVFQQVSVQEMFDANPPVYFRRNLKSIVAVARAHGVDVVLATYAFTKERNDPTGSSDEYIRAIGEMNATVKAVAAETGAHLFDFGAVFPPDRDLYVDGQHVNVEGSRLKARLYADYLVASGLLPASDGAAAAAVPAAGP